MVPVLTSVDGAGTYKEKEELTFLDTGAWTRHPLPVRVWDSPRYRWTLFKENN
jgi:hypothetical protein